MIRWLLTHFGFPVIVCLKKLFPKSAEKFELWFVNQNNNIVKRKDFRPLRVLLLLPHCLQNDDCQHRIVKTILNCKECGKCKIAEILKFVRKYDIIVKVATGGRLAKRLVDELIPEFVVAVACERELSEGIHSVYPLPVIGIPNIRPYGPCINTTVDVDKIKTVIETLCAYGTNN